LGIVATWRLSFLLVGLPEANQKRLAENALGFGAARKAGPAQRRPGATAKAASYAAFAESE
jgi:hypothetical protein